MTSLQYRQPDGVCGAYLRMLARRKQALLTRLLNKFNMKEDWLFKNMNRHVTKLVDMTMGTLLPSSNAILCSGFCEGSAAHNVSYCKV